MSAISAALPARAEDCQVESNAMDDIVEALKQAPNCDRAMKVFRACEFGTSADIRLIQYLEALKPSERWNHYPVASDEAALQNVVDGKLAAALVWGPSFWALQKSNSAFAKLRIISGKPLPPATVDVGAVMLGRETFLRANLDQAIAALSADGTIESILKGFDFPATPVR